MLWSDLTWEELPGALAAVGHAALLPVGATEQHGPHLGTGVDFVIAEALCKAVAYGWRVEDQTAGAQKIAALGKELYKRLALMGGHAASVGRALTTAVEKYNQFVGSLESQVMSQAKRFEDLKVDHEGAELVDLKPVDVGVRPLTKLDADPASDRPALTAIDR